MLLDTSGLFSLWDGDNPFHADAVRLYRDDGRRVTHDYVLAELIALAHVRGLPRKDVLAHMSRLVDDRSVEVHWLDERAFGTALAFLRGRLDKTYSLCDAASFVLMRQLEISEALTTDRNFEQEGFVRLLKR